MKRFFQVVLFFAIHIWNIPTYIILLLIGLWEWETCYASKFGDKIAEYFNEKFPWET